MKKRLFLILLALALTLGLGVSLAAPAAAEEAWTPEDFTYTLDPETGTILLTKYVGTAPQLTVHGSYAAEGETWRTVLDCATVFRGSTVLTSVTLEAGVGFRNDSMRLLFGECAKLTSVDLSAVDTSQVTDMAYMFYQCPAIKTLDLSSFDTANVRTIRGMFSGCTRLTGLTGYENWDTGSVVGMYQTFNAVGSASNAGVLACIDLSRWDLDQVLNTGWCFQNCRAQQILLPDNLAVMSAGFLNHATKVAGSTFTIPAGVKKIGYAHTIYDFATNDFVEFIVAEGNTAYKAVDGILYSADGTEMLAVPRNKPFPDGVYEIPEGVTFLGELSFSRNYNIHTLVLPDSYALRYVPVYDEEYIVYQDTGNLNAGTNLSIAIYCYTGINAYAVKDTNPRYASRDGLIYSKDMTHLAAVPARYDRPLDIPEGVTHWDREAMWADGGSTVDNLLSGCSGVTIPASLQFISGDQLAMLNRLRTNRASGSNPFTIALAEGSTAFRLDEDGNLVPGNVTVMEEPQDWNGVMGEYPAITVTALGDGLSYQWYYRNAGTETWRKSTDTDESYDSYPLTLERSGREVYCVVTDSRGNRAATRTAVMGFDVPQGHTGPRITVQPENWAGEYGEYPAVSVSAEGEGLTWQWYYRNKGREDWSVSSETDSTYDSYPLTAERDGRELYCVVTDKYGFSAVSGTAFMERYIPQGYTGPAITLQPVSWQGLPGEIPEIRLEAAGEDLRYQWYYRNAGTEAWKKSTETDESYDSYPLTAERAGRELYCVVTDKYGFSAVSDTVTLGFRLPEGYTGPVITEQPVSWTGSFGESPAIRVAAEGEGLVYQWYYRNAGTETWKKSSETDDCYDAYPLTAERAGRQVYCVVTDRYGFSAMSDAAEMLPG